jgi:hypothetical protein
MSKGIARGRFLACPKTYEFESREFASGSRLQSLTWTNPHGFLGTIAAAADLFTWLPPDGFFLSRIEKD